MSTQYWGACVLSRPRAWTKSQSQYVVGPLVGPKKDIARERHRPREASPERGIPRERHHPREASPKRGIARERHRPREASPERGIAPERHRPREVSPKRGIAKQRHRPRRTVAERRRRQDKASPREDTAKRTYRWCYPPMPMGTKDCGGGDTVRKPWTFIAQNSNKERWLQGHKF